MFAGGGSLPKQRGEKSNLLDKRKREEWSASCVSTSALEGATSRLPAEGTPTNYPEKERNRKRITQGKKNISVWSRITSWWNERKGGGTFWDPPDRLPNRKKSAERRLIPDYAFMYFLMTHLRTRRGTKEKDTISQFRAFYFLSKKENW